ncbi:hypothetical protein Golax_012102 [Gossypium laxum]|uniref:Uncharacterized protein n=1 Tax=Gossypium laxum TaxID=34288 RepID=A0A7J8ZMK1_9ROSI|nr:hypothetical protein [Gossypium laxum]
MLGERKWGCGPRWRWEKLRSIFLRRQRNKNRADTQTDKSMGIDDTWMLNKDKWTKKPFNAQLSVSDTNAVSSNSLESSKNKEPIGEGVFGENFDTVKELKTWVKKEMNFQPMPTRQAIWYQSHDIEEAKSKHWAISDIHA